MKIFITGLHRAATHTVAKQKAVEYNVPYLSEEIIKWDSIQAATEIANGMMPKWGRDGSVEFSRESSLDSGFVLHCPGLAHKTLDLDKLGDVYWATRDHESVLTSMINAGIRDMAWHIMKGFREEFPDDPIWQTIVYNGKNDAPSGFPKFCTLLIKVKEYFYDTKFKDLAQKIVVNDMEWYGDNLSDKKPLKCSARRKMMEALEDNESLRIY
jgi:hypothetical protein